MSQISVAILGLGRLGTSIGLALTRYNGGKNAQHQFDITGYDDGSGDADAAKRQNAVAKTVNHPIDAIRNTDIVVIAMPYAQVESTYKLIGADLRGGAVVLDFSPIKAPSIQWATAHLQESAYMVGVTAILNPAYLFDGRDTPENAQANAFDKGAFLLTPSTQCPKEAIELAADFASIVGASSHFMDVAEHDSLTAATESLPTLLSAAFFHMLHTSEGWDDAQRVTNPTFGRFTSAIADAHPDDTRDLLLNNREATTLYLDRLIGSLTTFRDIIADNNRDALEAALINGTTSYREWLTKRERAKWISQDEEERQRPSLMGSFMGDFFNRKGKKDGG